MNIEFFNNSTFWIALGSIGTFFMAIVTFATLWWNQEEKRKRENREISEKILEPLKQDLENIIYKVEQCNPPNEQWRWGFFKNTTLSFSKSMKSLRIFIIRFDDFLKENFPKREDQKYLKKIINEVIREKTLPLIIKLPQLTPKFEKSIKEGLANFDFYCKLPLLENTKIAERTGTGVTFFPLIFREIDFKTYREEIEKELKKKGFSGENIKQKEEFYLSIYTEDGYQCPAFLINEAIFNETSIILNERIKKNVKLQKFINNCREIYNQANKLKVEIEEFIKRSL